MFQHHHSDLEKSGVPVYMEHFSCWNGQAEIVWSHAVGDSLTAIAYYLIPICFLWLLRNYEFDWRLRFVCLVYAGFIFLCGTTHILDVVMIWRVTEPILHVDGALRLATGLFSVFSFAVSCWVIYFLRETLEHFSETARKVRQRLADRQFGEATTEIEIEYTRTLQQVKQFIRKREDFGGKQSNGN